MIRRLLIDVDPEEPVLGVVSDDFPSVMLERAEGGAPVPTIEIRGWSASTPGSSAFRAVIDDAARCGVLALRGRSSAAVAIAAWEVLTTWQRSVGRRNSASSGPCFERVLRAHAELHGGARPLVLVDRDHGLDTWQWLLRLRPFATMAAQIAALFHDVERIGVEGQRRAEHLAPDQAAFKEAHARVGAAMTRAVLHRLGVDPEVVDRACEIVERHERGGPEEELRAVCDADALSFLSLGSAAWIDAFGAEPGRRKIEHAVGRLGGRRRAVLARLRLRRDVKAVVDQVLASDGPPPAFVARH